MNELHTQQLKIKRLKEIYSVAEPHEELFIHGLILKNKIRLALLGFQKELENNIRGFDPNISRKLDAITVRLEE